MTQPSALFAGAATRLAKAVQRYQAAVDDFDREAARHLGVNETALRCLEILLDDSPEATPGVLAARLGVTTGSVTAVIDRLENLGYLTRTAHPTDRRKTVIRATDKAARQAYELYGPLMDDGYQELLPRYDVEQIELITGFLSHATDIHQHHIQRLRSMAAHLK